nr:MAG TPA: Protein of unknown function (DUF2477) [Caudoviricetes sp.]
MTWLHTEAGARHPLATPFLRYCQYSEAVFSDSSVFYSRWRLYHCCPCCHCCHCLLRLNRRSTRPINPHVGV